MPGKIVIQSILSVVVAGVCLFGSAGAWRWWNAWAFLGFMAVLGVVMGRFFTREKDLAAERQTSSQKAAAWDRVLAVLLAPVGPLVCLVLGGLDHRWGWTRTLDAWASASALVVMTGSMAFTLWAMTSNPFFSTHVRIQQDRGHVVVRAGPYWWVRHPGYVGAILYNLAVPVLLGSWAAMGAGVFIVLLLWVRTTLEDRTLQAELPGYREYAAAVRYRWLPGVW